MDDVRQQTIWYLVARGDAPWRWADDGDVISWRDGTTIAYRDEVAFILEWLIPHGWPPFGALVWLLAACRGKLPPPVAVGELSLPIDTPEADERTIRAEMSEMWNRHARVEKGLAHIALLPADLRTSPKAKAVLAETVFGQTGDSSAPAARQAIVAMLRSGALTDMMLNDPAALPPRHKREWLSLHDGLARLTPESLALRLRTGLDALPQAAPLPAAPAARVRALLAELRTDPEHSGLARLTRDFMAALQIPRLLSEQDEMPIGGFADLSNRGNLDRLLLSELAHDDLTLAVRIALQEALYLRREPPAKQPPATLAVLLDSGVRLWGVPRLLATAVALALIGKSTRDSQLAVFRASGDELEEVDLLNREGLTAHLAALETHAHPGRALPAFHRALESAARRDAVLITQRDVVNDPAFRRALLDSKIAPLYLAVVDRDGSFELLRHPPTAAPLCRAQVKVDDLFPAPPASIQTQFLLKDTTDRDRPLILSATPFPLLLPVRGRIQAAIETADGGGVCAMQNRTLLRWSDLSHGARTLAADLPRGSTIWLGETDDGDIFVVKAVSGQREVVCRIFGKEGTPQREYLWHFPEPPRRAEAHGGVLFVIGHLATRAMDLKGGYLLGSICVRQRLSHGRYFQTGDGWHLLVWNGHALSLEPMRLPGPEFSDVIVRVFDRPGCDGPWCVTRGGDVFSHEGIRVLQLGPIREEVHVLSKGRRLQAVIEKSGKPLLVDLARLKQWVVSENSVRDWPSPRAPDKGMRTKFHAISISPHRIQLVSRKGVRYEIVYREDFALFLIRPPDRTGTDIPLVPVKMEAAAGYSLKIARWPDGRCAWLDDRGMLHLRGPDRHQPEITLALCEGALAAWTSDGHWHGPEFFIGDNVASPAQEIWRRLIAFTG